MAKAEKLTCKVTKEVKDGLADIGRSIQTKKGGLSKAYRKLLADAFANPDAEFRTFDGDETETCSMEAKAELVQQLEAYQNHHRINERRKGFKRALLQGYSLHLERLEEDNA